MFSRVKSHFRLVLKISNRTGSFYDFQIWTLNHSAQRISNNWHNSKLRGFSNRTTWKCVEPKNQRLSFAIRFIFCRSEVPGHLYLEPMQVENALSDWTRSTLLFFPTTKVSHPIDMWCILHELNGWTSTTCSLQHKSKGKQFEHLLKQKDIAKYCSPRPQSYWYVDLSLSLDDHWST